MDRIERIRQRLNAAAPMHTPGGWYHDDIPYLLSLIERYRQIGEPSELRKMTFCRDCVHRGTAECITAYIRYAGDRFPDVREMKDDDFCSWGEPREERENEV